MGGGILLIYKLLGVSLAPYLYCFILGALLYYSWDKIKKFFEGKFLIWLAVYLVACYAFKIRPSYYIESVSTIIANLLLGIVTISAAFTCPKLGGFLKGNDISYGLYIYHMIVINVMVHIGAVGKPIHFVIAAALSIALASLSWFLLEKPCLALKRKAS